MKNENYFTVYGWMVNELELNIYELAIMAFIYSFKDGFEGSIQYIADSTNMSRIKAYRTLSDLCEKGFIRKEGQERKRCKYSVIQEITSCYPRDNKTVIQQTHNNNINNKSNNIYNLPSHKKGNYSGFNDFNQRNYNYSELENILRSN